MSRTGEKKRPIVSGLVLLGIGLCWLAADYELMSIREIIPLTLILIGVVVVAGAMMGRKKVQNGPASGLPPAEPPYTPPA